jgi:hypothetical protein
VHGICSLETSEIVDDNEKLIVMTVERVNSSILMRFAITIIIGE